jgi:transposase
LRELTAVVKWDKENWAAKLRRVLWLCWRAKRDGKTERYKVRLTALYDRYVAEGLAYHESLPPLEPPSGKKKGRKKRRVAHNLLRRLRDFKDGVLRHLEDALVPFTNNLAEQDLRMMKVKQKISGSFRSLQGAEDFCVLRGFISTARKQNRNILAALSTVCA